MAIVEVVFGGVDEYSPRRGVCSIGCRWIREEKEKEEEERRHDGDEDDDSKESQSQEANGRTTTTTTTQLTHPLLSPPAYPILLCHTYTPTV